MKISFYAAVAGILIIGATSCAYFNTFYNARDYYDRGVAPLKSGGQVRGDLLKKSIEKSSKILQFHQKSRYVEEALILIGKSYMYTGEYTKAVRKFNELMDYYPQSRFFDEALFYLGKTYMLQGEYQVAVSIFTTEISRKGKFKMNAFLETADMLIEKEQYEEAESLFAQLSQKESASPGIQLKAARIEYLRGNYENALEHILAVRKKSLKTADIYGYYKMYISSLIELGRYQDAEKIMNRAIKEMSDPRMKNSISILKAQLMVSYGKTNEAAGFLQEILAQPGGVQLKDSLLFQLASIYETHLDNYKKAYENYFKIYNDMPFSELAPKAEIKAKALDLLMTIREDSIKDDEEAVMNRFLLAEIYYLELKKTDMAMNYYRMIADTFPDSYYAPKSIYALAYINLTDKKDTAEAEVLLNRIIDEYGASDFLVPAENLLKEIDIAGKGD